MDENNNMNENTTSARNTSGADSTPTSAPNTSGADSTPTSAPNTSGANSTSTSNLSASANKETTSYYTGFDATPQTPTYHTDYNDTSTSTGTDTQNNTPVASNTYSYNSTSASSNSYSYNDTIVSTDDAPSTGFGIASLVMGILSILGSCCCGAGILFSILGIIFGCIQSKDAYGKKPGIAIAGIITSCVGIAIGIIAIIYIVLASSQSYSDIFRNYNIY